MAELLARTIAKVFNEALEVHEQFGLDKGVLILLHKPDRPTGPLTSLRRKASLSVLRKTLSLIVLSRIAPKIDLSPLQSGLRRGHSMADVLVGCRWLCAKVQRQRGTIEMLGIDLSHAFVAISRDKLPDTLDTFLNDSELRMFRHLLAEASPSNRACQ